LYTEQLCIQVQKVLALGFRERCGEAGVEGAFVSLVSSRTGQEVGDVYEERFLIKLFAMLDILAGSKELRYLCALFSDIKLTVILLLI